MTKFLKKDQLSSNWYEIDAKNAVVGRLATVISKIIRGKNKTTFTPHMDDGDFEKKKPERRDSKVPANRFTYSLDYESKLRYHRILRLLPRP